MSPIRVASSLEHANCTSVLGSTGNSAVAFIVLAQFVFNPMQPEDNPYLSFRKQITKLITYIYFSYLLNLN